MTYETQPVPYETPDVAMPPTRPKGVTVVAIIGIIFGAMGVLCVGGGMIVSMATTGSITGSGMKMGNATVTFPQDVQAFGAAASAISVLLSLMLLLGSIGALGLKAWARTLLLAWACVDLIYDIGKTIVTYIWLLPKMKQAYIDSGVMNDPNIARAMQWQEKIQMIVGPIMLLCIIALPIAILIVLNRRPAKVAFGLEQPDPLAPLPPAA